MNSKYDAVVPAGKRVLRSVQAVAGILHSKEVDIDA